MGLECFHQTQTPTALTLASRTPVPGESVRLLLGIALLIGTPVILLGSFALNLSTNMLTTLIGLLLVTIGLLPLAVVSYWLCTSLMAAEWCTFDRVSGRVTFKQRQGLFRSHTNQYCLKQIVDVRVEEEIQLLNEIEPYVIYRPILLLTNGESLPITSLACYYREVPQDVVDSIRKFLRLRVKSTSEVLR